MASAAGKVAFVTGSTQGIGLSIAKLLANEGCNIILTGLATPDQIEAAKKEVQMRSVQLHVKVPTGLCVGVQLTVKPWRHRGVFAFHKVDGGPRCSVWPQHRNLAMQIVGAALGAPRPRFAFPVTKP